MKIRLLDLLVIALAMTLLSAVIVNALPSGATNLIVGPKERKNDSQQGTPVPYGALAGNVTALDITGSSVTKFWQGYYGNVSGTIQLADSNNNSLYNWAAASPNGEIYAARIANINWVNNIDCANRTLIADEDNVFLGVNVTSDPDSTNATFNRKGHPSFFVGGNPLAFTNCNSTSVATDGSGVVFWEALLQANSSATLIYTAIIMQDTAGFNGINHDFQMLVSEKGNGAQEYPSGTATTYYFFVELG